MSVVRTQPIILAIGVRNDFLHVYQDEKELLTDDTIGAGQAELSGPIEFFDGDGHRLTGVYDRKWNLLELVPTTSPPDLPTLLRRVRKAFEHLRSFIETHPQELSGNNIELRAALLQLRGVSTSAELREFLQNFIAHPSAKKDEAVEKPVDRPVGIAIVDDQPGLHNAWHRAGWNHG
ncbi:MAG: hypothetical protein ACRDTG_24195 [Pseudonocardiaceae bacterium]